MFEFLRLEILSADIYKEVRAGSKRHPCLWALVLAPAGPRVRFSGVSSEPVGGPWLVQACRSAARAPGRS